MQSLRSYDCQQSKSAVRREKRHAKMPHLTFTGKQPDAPPPYVQFAHFICSYPPHLLQLLTERILFMQNSSFQTIKKITRQAIVRTLPKEMTDFLFSLKHRVAWRRDNHSHLLYQADYSGREPVIVEIKRLMDNIGCDNPRIFEFGCSGANVLLLIKKHFPNHVYCGVDLNENAIAFAREKFPNDTFYVCDDVGFPKLIPQLGHYNVFLALGVFYYINSAKVQEILIKAAQIADYVVVLDELSCFNLPSGKNEGLFFHSFSTMCRNAGLEVIVEPVFSNGPRKTEGYFIARSSARDTAANNGSLDIPAGNS
jgi:SAM-dependent methyltransferase